MRSIDYLPGLMQQLCDPEFAAAYFIQAAARGNLAELDLALNDIVRAGAGRMYLHVELTKLRASPHAAEPPGNWNEYQSGDLSNTTSPPVDYTLTGILLVPPRIGFRVKVLRVIRNDVHVPGMFESTEVVELAHEGFITRNSVYRLERLKPPLAGTPGETSAKN